jgi:hypothetical protein
MTESSIQPPIAGSTQKALLWTLGGILLAVPLLLTLLWGTTFSDRVYGLLQAAGQMMGGNLTALRSAIAIQNPLVVLLLGSGLAQHATFVGALSALGWSATAAAVYWGLSALGQRPSGTAAALLIVFSPLVVSTAGAPTSWVLALGWTALALNARPTQPALKIGLLLLMLGLHVDTAVFVFALAVLILDGITGRSGWGPAFAFTGIVFGGLAIAFWFNGGPQATPPATPSWWNSLPSLARDKQLWWLFLPFAAAGLVSVIRAGGDGVESRNKSGLLQQTTGLGGLWAGAALLSDSVMAPAVLAVTVQVLAGLGVHALLQGVQERGRTAIGGRRQTAVLQALLLMLLLIAQVLLARRHASPDLTRLAAAQAQAAAWLADNSEPGTTLLAAQRIGYLAQRATAPLLIEQAGPQNASRLYTQIMASPPEFVVSQRTEAWDVITRSGWFKERYAPQTQIKDSYAAAAPLTIWRYQPSPFDDGDLQQIAARVPQQFELVGYKVQPAVFTPGEDIFITLYLRALEAVANGFITGVHLVAPDGHVWAWREEQTPRSLSGAWWQPGQVISERFRIPTTTDVPSGAYSVETFWRAADNDDRQLPVFQGGDENMLDRVKLGYVAAPGNTAVDGSVPVDAQFGEQIRLLETAVGPAIPGAALDVTLVWEALSPPAGDYTVFVHVLNQAGDVVAGHDAKPMENRFPTQAFQPGVRVIDRHQLALPADLPPGRYTLSTGLYQLESGERLPVWDKNGTEQENSSLPLGEITIPGE